MSQCDKEESGNDILCKLMLPAASCNGNLSKGLRCYVLT